MDQAVRVLILLPESENAQDKYGRALSARFPRLRTDWARHHSEVGELAKTARVILTFSPFIAPHVAEAATELEWLQILGSGLDGIAELPFRRKVVVTSGHGVQATPVSEAALGLMFALCRGVPRLALNQQARRWERWPSRLLSGKTVVIVGVGAIAEALAPKCKALGMRVVGLSSTPRPAPGFDLIRPKTELLAAAAEADFLVLLTPYSEATRHLIGGEVFAAMKQSAYLVNVARGGVVDEDALVSALQRGQIAGAALDVFETQPLPADSRLWTQPNVIISPHMAGLNDAYAEQIFPLLEKNFEAFLGGHLEGMVNRVAVGRPES